MRFTRRSVGPGATAPASTAELGASPAEADAGRRGPGGAVGADPPSPACSRPPPCCSSTACAGSTRRSGSTSGDGAVAPGCAPPTRRASCAAAQSDGAHLTRGSRCGAASSPRPRGRREDRHAGRAPTTSSTARAREDVAPAQVLSAALQGDLAEVEADGRPRGPGEATASATTCSCSTGRCSGAAPLPRAIGFVKSHRSDYLPPAGRGRRRRSRRASAPRLPHRAALPASTAGTCGCPGRPARRGRGSRGSSAAATSRRRPRSRSPTSAQVTLVRYASAEYKDAARPAEPLPDRGPGTRLRRRLGEPALLYRALRAAAA